MYIVLAYTVLKMDKGSRIDYTEEQKRILLQFFEEGMKSTKFGNVARRLAYPSNK